MRHFAALTMVALAAACGRESTLPYYTSAALTPEWLSARAASAPSMHRVAAFAMQDQRGDVITEHSFAGKATLVQFFFTTCRDICPTTTSNLAKALRDIGTDARVQLLSYSVTPEQDSIGALREFARTRGITDPRWHLLSGGRDDVIRLASQSYFVGLGDAQTYGVESVKHTETLVLIDSARRIRGVYAGSLALEMDRLKEDVATLLNEQAFSGRLRRARATSPRAGRAQSDD